MASHVKTSTPERMRELLAYHEHAADALRTALSLLNGHLTTSAHTRHETTLTKALDLDAKRRGGVNSDVLRRRAYQKQWRAKRKKNHTAAALPIRPTAKGWKLKTANPSTWKANKIAARRRSEAFLAHFNTETPVSHSGSVGAYVQSGYLKRKGDGYVRTDKPYTVRT